MWVIWVFALLVALLVLLAHSIAAMYRWMRWTAWDRRPCTVWPSKATCRPVVSSCRMPSTPALCHTKATQQHSWLLTTFRSYCRVRLTCCLSSLLVIDFNRNAHTLCFIQKLLQGEAYVLFVITSCDRFQQECTDTVFHSEATAGWGWRVVCHHFLW